MSTNWKSIVSWCYKFESGYSRYLGGRLSLSLLPSQSGTRWRFFESTFFGCIHSSQLSISTDEWRKKMVTNVWRMRRTNDAPLLAPYYFRFGISSRVSGALQVVQRPAWQEHSFTASRIASTLRSFSFGKSSIETKLKWTLRRYTADWSWLFGTSSERESFCLHVDVGIWLEMISNKLNVLLMWWSL